MRRDDISLYLGPADRARLETVLTDRNTPRKVVWRAEIILATADGYGTNEIMRRARTSKPTVWRWQSRYLDEGVAGLLRDKTRPSRVPPLPRETRLMVIAKTVQEAPPNATSEVIGRSVGGYAIAWNREEVDSGSETDVYFRLLDRTGTGETAAVMVNSDRRSGEQNLQDVVDLGAGRTLVTYFHQIPDAIDDLFDGGVLYGRVFGPNGRALTASFKISEGDPYENMGGGNTIINQQGRIVSTFQAELTYANDDDVIITSRTLTLPVVSGSGAGTAIQGTNVNDRIRANGGNDTVNGHRGDDRLTGGAGHDFVSGGQGNDAIWGDGGNDRLRGDSGNDTLYGGSGSDRIAAGAGNDRLFGDTGNDILWGNSGRDRISGGTGNDTLYGGSGVDTFVFAKGYDRDVIADFENNVDTIMLTNGVRSFSQARSFAEQVGKDVVFDFGAGDVLIVRSIKIAALADDLTFG